jgi:hypothetical protein
MGALELVDWGFTMSRFLIAALLAAVASPVMAATDFTGTSVTASLLFPDTSTTYAGPATATVGGGIEFEQGTFSPAQGSLDIGTNTLTYFANVGAVYSTASFNGFRVDFDRAIASVSFLGGKTPTGFSFSGNSVFLNVSGQGYDSSDFTSLSITAVPEPAAWAMMIGGFGLIGAASRRRLRSSVTYA